ncbi:MAG: OmpH/Skp family outer membrane protein [Endomicrobiales bacterium]
MIMNRPHKPYFAVCAAVFLLAFSLCAPLSALEIPVGVVPPSGQGTAPQGVIAYVDIEALFAEHPMRKRLQGEFLAEAEKRKKELAGLEGSIAAFEKIIASSTTEVNQAKNEAEDMAREAAKPPAQPQTMVLPGTTEAVRLPGVSQSSAPAATPALTEARLKEISDKEAGLETMKKELQTRKEELALKVKQNKEDLIRLEENQSARVLTDLYQLLDAVAGEKGITIILDKNNVLYGQQYQDLTQEIRQRLTGR